MTSTSTGRRECPPLSLLAEDLLAQTGRCDDHIAHCETCAQSCALLRAVQLRWPSNDARIGACPSITEWTLLLQPDISEEARDGLTEHLASCDECCALWSFLADSFADPPEELELRERNSHEEDAASALPRAGTPWSIILALRWVAALLVSGTLLFGVLELISPIGFASSSRWLGPVATMNAEVVAARPGASGPVLVWELVAEAASYRVEVWRATGEQLLDDQIDGASTERTLDIDELLPGDVILYRVTALREGASVGSSALGSYTWAGQ